MKLDKLCLTDGDYFDHCVSDERGFPDIWTIDNEQWVLVAYPIGEIKMYPMHRVAWATPRHEIKYGDGVAYD